MKIIVDFILSNLKFGDVKFWIKKSLKPWKRSLKPRKSKLSSVAMY